LHTAVNQQTPREFSSYFFCSFSELWLQRERSREKERGMSISFMRKPAIVGRESQWQTTDSGRFLRMCLSAFNKLHILWNSFHVYIHRLLLHIIVKDALSLPFLNYLLSFRNFLFGFIILDRCFYLYRCLNWFKILFKKLRQSLLNFDLTMILKVI
jgi:hypothetical protein